MARPLTVKTLENLKPDSARKEVPDGLVRGLFFVLQPSGKASWAVRYRVASQTRKLTLGTFPAIHLKAARELACRALVKVAGGDDPAAEKQAAKAAGRIPNDRDLIEKIASQFIAGRTKAALAAAKARGVKLGNPNIEHARERAIAVIKGEAERAAGNVLPIINEVRRAGATSLCQIAEALNSRGISTPRGGVWYATSVRNVVARANY